MGRVAQVPDPSLDTRPLPTPYQQPFATPQGQGAGFGDVLEGAAHVASQFERDAKEQADTTADQAAQASGKLIVATKVTDADPNGVGYLRLRGKDALAAR